MTTERDSGETEKKKVRLDNQEFEEKINKVSDEPKQILRRILRLF